MSIKLWAFRDGRGIVRITPSDPSAVLMAEPYLRQRTTASAPGGFSMRDLRRHFETTEATLAGNSGTETFVEFELNELDDSVLRVLMIDPENPPDPDEPGEAGEQTPEPGASAPK